MVRRYYRIVIAAVLFIAGAYLVFAYSDTPSAKSMGGAILALSAFVASAPVLRRPNDPVGDETSMSTTTGKGRPFPRIGQAGIALIGATLALGGLLYFSPHFGVFSMPIVMVFCAAVIATFIYGFFLFFLRK